MEYSKSLAILTILMVLAPLAGAVNTTTSTIDKLCEFNLDGQQNRALEPGTRAIVDSMKKPHGFDNYPIESMQITAIREAIPKTLALLEGRVAADESLGHRLRRYKATANIDSEIVTSIGFDREAPAGFTFDEMSYTEEPTRVQFKRHSEFNGQEVELTMTASASVQVHIRGIGRERQTAPIKKNYVSPEDYLQLSVTVRSAAANEALQAELNRRFEAAARIVSALIYDHRDVRKDNYSRSQAGFSPETWLAHDSSPNKTKYSVPIKVRSGYTRLHGRKSYAAGHILISVFSELLSADSRFIDLILTGIQFEN